MIDIPILAKDALAEGNTKKEYVITVYDSLGDVDFIIDNDYLVCESVKIDERLCSADTLKYGLCEGSSIEFQYFDKPVIKGRRIKVELKVYYDSTYSLIPMGFFVIDGLSRQASTGIYKVTGYNKLQAKTLDEKANQKIIDYLRDNNTADLGVILDLLLDDYSLITDYSMVELNNFRGTEDTYYQYEEVENGVKTDYYIGFICRWVKASIVNFAPLDKYYKVTCNPRKLYEKLLTYIPSSYRDKYCRLANTSNTPVQLKDLVSFSIWYGSESITIDSQSSDELAIIELHKPAITSYDIEFDIPTFFRRTYDSSGAPSISDNFSNDDYTTAVERVQAIAENSVLFTFEEYQPSGIEAIEMTYTDSLNYPDVTLRDLQSAVFEINCQFGKLDREKDKFHGMELVDSGLLPSTSLYPNNDLYPNGAVLSGFRSIYSKLWADEGNIQKWRYLIVTYQNTNGETAKEQVTVNSDGTQDYNCSDNWLFNNFQWRPQDIRPYVEAMALKMQSITWFPFEMWCVGLPYIETGDLIEIPIGEDTYKSYILQRNIKGIQNLEDTYINGELDIF